MQKIAKIFSVSIFLLAIFLFAFHSQAPKAFAQSYYDCGGQGSNSADCGDGSTGTPVYYCPDGTPTYNTATCSSGTTSGGGSSYGGQQSSGGGYNQGYTCPDGTVVAYYTECPNYSSGGSSSGGGSTACAGYYYNCGNGICDPYNDGGSYCYGGQPDTGYPGQSTGSNGSQVCSNGFTAAQYGGACPTLCPDGLNYTYPGNPCPNTSAGGGTNCPTGQFFNGNVCVGTAANCTAGQYWNNYQCTSCPAGQTFNGTLCVSSSGSSGNNCPTGTFWNGNLCIPTTNGNPVALGGACVNGASNSGFQCASPNICLPDPSLTNNVGYCCSPGSKSIVNHQCSSSTQSGNNNNQPNQQSTGCSGSNCSACGQTQCGSTGGSCQWRYDSVSNKTACFPSQGGGTSGSACYFGTQCQSGNCSNSVCKAGTAPSGGATGTPPPPGGGTGTPANTCSNGGTRCADNTCWPSSVYCYFHGGTPTPSGNSGAPGVPGSSSSGNGVSINADKTSYNIGDTAQVCYTVPGPGPITITDSQSGGTDYSGTESGTGSCLSGTVQPPTGQDCLTITFSGSGGGTAQACFQINDSGSSGGSSSGGSGSTPSASSSGGTTGGTGNGGNASPSDFGDCGCASKSCILFNIQGNNAIGCCANPGSTVPNPDCHQVTASGGGSGSGGGGNGTGGTGGTTGSPTPPLCDISSGNCTACSNVAANTCSTNNGTRTCTFDTSSSGANCTTVQIPNNPCTLNNCNTGSACQNGSCVVGATPTTVIPQ